MVKMLLKIYSNIYHVLIKNLILNESYRIFNLGDSMKTSTIYGIASGLCVLAGLTIIKKEKDTGFFSSCLNEDIVLEEEICDKSSTAEDNTHYFNELLKFSNAVKNEKDNLEMRIMEEHRAQDLNVKTTNRYIYENQKPRLVTEVNSYRDENSATVLYKMTQQYLNNYPVVMDFKDRINLVREEILDIVHIETSSIDPNSNTKFGLGCILCDDTKHGYILIYNEPYFQEIVLEGLPQMSLVNGIIINNQLYIVGYTFCETTNKTRGIIIKYDMLSFKTEYRIYDEASDFLSINKVDENLFILGNSHKNTIASVEIDLDFTKDEITVV